MTLGYRYFHELGMANAKMKSWQFDHFYLFIPLTVAYIEIYPLSLYYPNISWRCQLIYSPSGQQSSVVKFHYIYIFASLTLLVAGVFYHRDESGCTQWSSVFDLIFIKLNVQ